MNDKQPICVEPPPSANDLGSSTLKPALLSGWEPKPFVSLWKITASALLLTMTVGMSCMTDTSLIYLHETKYVEYFIHCYNKPPNDTPEIYRLMVPRYFLHNSTKISAHTWGLFMLATYSVEDGVVLPSTQDVKVCNRPKCGYRISFTLENRWSKGGTLDFRKVVQNIIYKKEGEFPDKKTVTKSNIDDNTILIEERFLIEATRQLDKNYYIRETQDGKNLILSCSINAPYPHCEGYTTLQKEIGLTITYFFPMDLFGEWENIERSMQNLIGEWFVEKISQ